MKYDAIVIGGGHNGLVAACYLAMNGMRVGVFEANNFLGGMASTPEIWEGYRVPIGAYVLSLFSEKIARELGLFERGLKLIPKEPGMTVFLEGKRVISMWSSKEKTVKEIARFSERDARAYEEWDKLWSMVGGLMEYLYSRPPIGLLEAVDISQRSLRLVKALGLEGKVEEAVRILLSPASRVLDEFFESEETKALLVEDALVGELIPPSAPASSLVMAHHYMGNITGVRGQWAYVTGGMGALAEILAKRCAELGIDIHLGKRVDEIVVKNGRAVGVRVGGELVESKWIISTADVRKTLLELAGEHIDKALARRLRGLRSCGASGKIVIATKDLPRLKREYESYASQIFSSSAVVMESVEYAERAYRDAVERGFSERPWLSINTQSYLDASVAPEGRHLLSVFAQYVSCKERSGWSEEAKMRLWESVREVLLERFEAIEPERLLVLTPKDYEEMFGAPGGHIFHISMSLDQLWINRPLPELASYRTPIEGLYLGGASAHPGGGVTGLPGYLSAMAVLENAGIVKRKRVSLTDMLVERLKARLRL